MKAEKLPIRTAIVHPISIINEVLVLVGWLMDVISMALVVIIAGVAFVIVAGVAVVVFLLVIVLSWLISSQFELAG